MRIVTNGVLIAIVAHAIIGVSLVWDKVLLQRPATKSLANYVFWLGAISIFGLVLIPFGFKMPSAATAGLAMLAGFLDLAGTWFYYAALQMGEASETLAVMGGFTPLATALIAIPLLSKPFGDASALAFALMVAGGFAMFVAERLNWRRILPAVGLSAGLFGLTNVLQKIVFNHAGFVSGYVFFTLGTFVGAIALLLRPRWREQIFRSSQDAPPRSRFWYFVNRFIAGVGSFLVVFAISRSNPATVSAIEGVRYAVIFIGAYLVTKFKPEWLREDFHRRALIGKSIGTGLIVAGLALIGVGGSGEGGPGASVTIWMLAIVMNCAAEPQAEPDRTDIGRHAAVRFLKSFISTRIEGKFMRENMGPTEQKIRMAVGSAAAAAAIFAPLEYKWKGLLAFAAFAGLFTGTTGFSPFKKALAIGRRG